MNIEKQEATGDIVNVLGNLELNGGTLQVESLYINGNSGESSLTNQIDSQNLASRYDISYLDFVAKEFEKKTIIDRPIISEIISLLSVTKELALIGLPGVGKTCLLVQVSNKLSNVVYFSVRNKSLLITLSHLINKISIIYGNPLITINDPDIGLEILQGILSSSEVTILLDDCEASPELINRVLPLFKGNNTFIYASRTDVEMQGAGIRCFQVGTFTVAETQVFLNLSEIELDILSFNELYEASQGNPLYLFYFSKFQIKPYPVSIEQYHSEIWHMLNAKQQECLINVSLSYYPINVDVILKLFDFSYLTEANHFVNDLVVLARNEKGELEIFHPAFQEFIINEVKKNGLINSYKLKLGEYYLSNNELVQAAFLLLDVKPEALKEIGFQVIPIVLNSGDLEFGNRILKCLLDLKPTLLEKGYLEYHLSINYRLTNNKQEANIFLQESLKSFTKARSKRWYFAALMNQAMNLVEDGNHEEGLNLADEILQKSSKYGDQFKGQLLVNLSKIYVDLHEYKKSAKSSKLAYEFFEKKGNGYGMVSSLANLASALAQMNDYSDISETYALKLLELSDKNISFHIELIALNILTSINRQAHKYKEAKIYGEKAVRLCQHYKLLNKALLNLINYGNVLKDNGEVEEAIKVYQDALVHAVNFDSKKEQSRIYWILSDVYFDKGDYTKSLEYIDLSIWMSSEVNYNYGVAHGYEEKASVLLKLDRKSDAALAFENSSSAFKKIENFVRAYRRNLSKAIMLYFEIGEQEKANRLLSSSTENLAGDAFIDLRGILGTYDNKIDVHAYFQELCIKYVKQEGEQNLVQEFLAYLDYCLRHLKSSKESFISLLTVLAKNTEVNRFSKPILAILLDQSKELVDFEDIKVILKSLSETLPDFHPRNIEHETIILASISEDINLEIAYFQDELICQKLALSLILFLYSAPELVHLTNRAVKEKFCRINFVLRDGIQKQLKDLKLPKLNNKNIQTLHVGKKDYSHPEMIIIYEEYEALSDLAIHSNNKCSMYFLGATIRGLISHFYHIKRSSREFPKSITRQIAFFFDYTEVEEVKAQKQNYAVNLEKLSQLEIEYAGA